MSQIARRKVSKNHPWRKSSRQGWLIWTDKHTPKEAVGVDRQVKEQQPSPFSDPLGPDDGQKDLDPLLSH